MVYEQVSKNPFRKRGVYLFDHASFLEGCVRTVLGDRAQTLCRYVDRYGLADFWYINTLLLEVCVLARRGDRVKFGRTNLGRVSTRNL